MNIAFEICQEDVANVALEMMGAVISDEKSAALLGMMDIEAITKAALSGDDMDEQISYAYKEIHIQLKALGRSVISG
jgi:hypothetical protein